MAFSASEEQSFCKIIKKSNLLRSHLSLPSEFCRKNRESVQGGKIILQKTPNSKIYPLTLENNRVVVSGWKQFAEDYKLQAGEIVIFTLVQGSIFTFEIYGRDGFIREDVSNIRNALTGPIPNLSGEHLDDEADSNVLAGQVVKVSPNDQDNEGDSSFAANSFKVVPVRREESPLGLDLELEVKQEREDSFNLDIDPLAERFPVSTSTTVPHEAIEFTRSFKVEHRHKYTLYINTPYHKEFPSETARVCLIDCNNKKWEMTWNPTVRQLTKNLPAFCKSNDIKIGDVLEFVPHGNHQFSVLKL